MRLMGGGGGGDCVGVGGPGRLKKQEAAIKVG